MTGGQASSGTPEQTMTSHVRNAFDSIHQPDGPYDFLMDIATGSGEPRHGGRMFVFQNNMPGTQRTSIRVAVKVGGGICVEKGLTAGSYSDRMITSEYRLVLPSFPDIVHCDFISSDYDRQLLRVVIPSGQPTVVLPHGLQAFVEGVNTATTDVAQAAHTSPPATI